MHNGFKSINNYVTTSVPKPYFYCRKILIKGEKLIVAGQYEGKVDFDPSADSTFIFNPRFNIYVAKYDTNGVFDTVHYTKSNPVALYYRDISINENNDVFIFGLTYSGSNLSFNSTSVINQNSDYFVAKYDSGFNYKWSLFGNFTPPVFDGSDKALFEKNNDVYLLGNLNDSTNFTHNYCSNNYHNPLNQDGFLLKFGNCSPVFSSDTFDMCQGDSLFINGIYYSSPGNFIDTIKSCNNCDSIITLNIIFNTVDTSITQVGNTLVSNNDTLASFQWIDCSNMLPINGATNQSFTPTSSGNYALVITNNGCSDTSNCYSIQNVGIIENDFGDKLLIYPNPTDGNFWIDLGEKYDAIKVNIFELRGNLLKSMLYHEKQLLELNVDEPVGVYLLQIETENKKALIRLVKK